MSFNENNISLTKSNLGLLSAKVQVPSYDFDSCSSSIVHIGIGAFHKAHQARVTDKLMEHCGGDYRITAVSLRSTTARDLLAKNDYLYTCIEKQSDELTYKICAAIEKVLVAPESPEAVIQALSSSKVHTVTSTITEKGYCFLPGNQGLDFNNVDISHDLLNLEHPKTFIGLFVSACQKRMHTHEQGFDYICCDNLPNNSTIVGQAIIQFAGKVSESLATWITNNISFCNSMVDRIVPAVSPNDLQQLEQDCHYTDEALVVSEPFFQWVIEDNFKYPRPPWERVGVQLVDNVAKYETLKLRFLNGSHSALAYLGKVSGIEYIHQAIIQPQLNVLIRHLMHDMSATLDDGLDVDVSEYGKTIVQRFSNNAIQYQTQQVATDGSQKLPQRILEPMSELLSKNVTSEPMCAVLAGWFVYLMGKDEQGNTIAINDPLSQELQDIVLDQTQSIDFRVNALMSVKGLFPDVVINSVQSRACIIDFINEFLESGIVSTLSKRFPA